MTALAAKVRDDLEYYEQVIDGDEVVFVRDPVRGAFFKYNALQAAMLRALDGKRSAEEITTELSARFDVEVPPAAAERFVARARENMLLEINSYETTPKAARKELRKALRKAGFRKREPGAATQGRKLSPESAMFAEALRQLELGHPRAAAGYLSKLLDQNPNNTRARQLHQLIQTAFIRASGATSDFPTIKLFNPNRLLRWLSRTIGRVYFSWIGVLAAIAFWCIGAYAYTLVSFDRVSLGVLDIAVAVVLNMTGGLLHELGHGLACQYYGGNVTEIGMTFFYYLRPAVYCDTSTSYLIQNRRHKVIVQLGGIVVSLTFLASLSIAAAVLHPSLPIYPGLVLEIYIESAVMFATLIPLMKFDGYYAICDYANFPNMRDRSFKLARAWLAKRLLGIESPSEQLPDRTRTLLIAYAFAATTFTLWFIYVAYSHLLTAVVERFRLPGLVIGFVATAYALRNVTLRPVWNVVRLVVRERRTVFTLRRTAVLVVLATVLIGPWFLPWPVLVDADFTVAPHQRAEIRAQVGGRVQEIRVKEGDRVQRGQVLAVLGDPALQARIAAHEAQLEAAMHRLGQLRSGATPQELALARSRALEAHSAAQRSAADAVVATRLANAQLDTASRADRAAGLLANDVGAARAADAALSLVEAGARAEDIRIADAERARLASELARLQGDAALLTLRSPIDGVVVTPHLEEKVETALAAGETLAEVAEVDRVVAEVSLSLADPLGEIAVGDEVVLRAYGDPHGEIRARIERFREAVQKSGAERRVIAVTAPFALDRPVAGLTGHARIYGAERNLAYTMLYLPLQRLMRVELWSM